MLFSLFTQSSGFFDPDNADGVKAREECADRALDDMMNFFREGGQIAIYDGTNSTLSRRSKVTKRVNESDMNVGLLWIESECTDRKIIETNIRETKLRSPDYTDTAPEAAIEDFRERIENYERGYEPFDDEAASFIKVVNFGRKVISNRIYGKFT